MDNVASSTATAGQVGYPARSARPAQRRPDTRWVVTALLVLGIIPTVLGIAHLATVVAGMDVSDKALYFLASPVPIGLHVAGAALYVLLGPLQFAAGFRRRAPHWHRVAGRLLVISGLLVALSALWMTLTLPHRPGAGDILFAARLVFGSVMIAALTLGFVAIRRGDVLSHRRWMTRAYAIGLGAGTQVPVLMLAEIIAGHPDDLRRAVLMGGAWVVNLAVAEWLVRRRQ
jgi:uncharacterized membrane protein